MASARRSSHRRHGAVGVVLLLTLTSCGISSGDASLGSSDGGRRDDGTSGTSGTATSEMAMREPRTLCERISQEAIEDATQLQLDPGTPTEEDGFPRCDWRFEGGDVAVSVVLEPPIAASELSEYASSNKFDVPSSPEDVPEEVPDLGEHAVWSPLTNRVWALTDEGLFSVSMPYADSGDDSKRDILDIEVAILRTVIGTTEVPDTTTTTPTTVAPEPSGLCARLSFETVQKIVDEPIEPGRTEPWDDAGRTCEFRTMTDGWIVHLWFFEGYELPDNSGLKYWERAEIAGRQAWITTDQVDVATPDGYLMIEFRLGFTSAEALAAATPLIEEFLASA